MVHAGTLVSYTHTAIELSPNLKLIQMVDYPFMMATAMPNGRELVRKRVRPDSVPDPSTRDEKGYDTFTVFSLCR